ncbi:Carbonic anhydrase 2 [Termitomyces sp. T112]|nr:Carbonic anhydrase 2 [Termitomyces sp. T112]
MSDLDTLLNGLFTANAQWAKDVEAAEPGFFQESVKGQAPHTLWIGCADSRVPESVVLGARPGDVFVHRNIANQFPLDDVNSKAVLEYAVNFLGVQHVVVVGHTECGGATACLAAAKRTTFPEHGQLLTIPTLPYEAPLNQWLEPLTRLAGTLDLSTTPMEEALPVVVEENVKLQVENLSKTTTLANAWASNDNRRNVRVHGWVYNLNTGLLKDLQVTKGASTRV